MSKKNKIIVIDWGCFIHQSIFSKLSMPKNTPPSDYICLSSILGCLKKVGVDKGDEIIVAVDFLKSWRKIYEVSYKADRKAKREKYPIDWKKEYGKMNFLLDNIEEATNWKVVKCEHLEADDIMSVVVRDNKDKEVILITFDHDMFQLWSIGNCKIFSPKTKRYKIKPKNFNVYQVISKMIKKEASDNLTSEILTEEDWKNREICVAGCTYILGLKGAKEIRHLKVGDKVLSYNFKKELIEPKEILKIYKTKSTERIKLEFSTKKSHLKTKKLLITKNHPVYTTKGWKKVKDLKVGDILMRNYDLIKNIKKGVKNVGYKLGYIHGYFAGDGGKDKNENIIFGSININSMKRIEKYIFDLFKFNVKIIKKKIITNKNYYTIYVPRYLNILRYYKKISSYGDSQLKGFIAGFFDAEGHLDEIKEKEHIKWAISISNTDEKLIYYVYNILKKFNLEPKIYNFNRKNNYKKIYRINILKKLNVFKFFLLFKPGIKSKYPRLYKLSNGYKIKKITKLKTSKLPRAKKNLFINWNLEVKDNNNYFANGCLVHNCVNLLTLPDWVEERVRKELELKSYGEEEPELLLFNSLKKRYKEIYKKKKLETYEKSKKYYERKAKRKKKRRKTNEIS